MTVTSLFTDMAENIPFLSNLLDIYEPSLLPTKVHTEFIFWMQILETLWTWFTILLIQRVYNFCRDFLLLSQALVTTLTTHILCEMN